MDHADEVFIAAVIAADIRLPKLSACAIVSSAQALLRYAVKAIAATPSTRAPRTIAVSISARAKPAPAKDALEAGAHDRLQLNLMGFGLMSLRLRQKIVEG